MKTFKARHQKFIDDSRAISKKAKVFVREELTSSFDLVDFLEHPEKLKKEYVDGLMSELEDYLDEAVELGIDFGEDKLDYVND